MQMVIGVGSCIAAPTAAKAAASAPPAPGSPAHWPQPLCTGQVLTFDDIDTTMSPHYMFLADSNPTQGIRDQPWTVDNFAKVYGNNAGTLSPCCAALAIKVQQDMFSTWT